MAPPVRPPKENRAQEKPRLDVATPAPALKHNPFAALGGAGPPAPVPLPSAVASSPAAVPLVVASPPAVVPSAGPSPPAAKKSSGRLILRRETKHRGGKTVVIVSGFAQLTGISESALQELLQELKQRLGCGGTVVARELLLQGDRPAQVAALLRERGFRVDGVTG